MRKVDLVDIGIKDGCGQPVLMEEACKSRNNKPSSKLKDGYVALFVDGLVLGGKCKFTATKADKFSGEAVFQITYYGKRY